MTISNILDRRYLTEDTFVLRVERHSKIIKAGQCFSIGTRNLGINREYSMYSSSSDEWIEFLIRKIDQGAVSTELGDIEIGKSIEVHGPFGEFCLSEETITTNKFLFIASGVGIAPFSSFVKSFSNLDYSIVHGIRYENEKYEYQQYIGNRYFPCISRPKERFGRPMRVTDYLKTLSVANYSKIYLCGNQSMITDSVEILKAKNFLASEIFTEVFF